jgi:hypothetical protein
LPDTDPVADLLAGRKILRVPPSAAFVNSRLKQAADNADSGKLLCGSNPRAVVTIAYDAIRFAVDANNAKAEHTPPRRRRVRLLSK